MPAQEDHRQDRQIIGAGLRHEDAQLAQQRRQNPNDRNIKQTLAGDRQKERRTLLSQRLQQHRRDIISSNHRHRNRIAIKHHPAHFDNRRLAGEDLHDLRRQRKIEDRRKTAVYRYPCQGAFQRLLQPRPVAGTVIIRRKRLEPLREADDREHD